MTVALVAGCTCVQTAAADVLTGVSDQRATFFEAPSYRALQINTVRLVVPWDAAGRPGPWDAWIARAQRDGATIMLALQHENSSDCPRSPCEPPPVDDYGDALQALLAKYPAIHEITAWNEPNDRAQPTWEDPALAARYHDEARARCPTCLVVAGDFLDDGSLSSYLSAYQAALRTSPEVWGLHDYLDAMYFRSDGVETMLRQTSVPLWLTETGGIVRLTFADGDVFSYDEQRAADSVAWLYGLTAARPRIERMYLYQWQGAREDHWDSGLLGFDATPRPAYRVVAAHVAQRGDPGSLPVSNGSHETRVVRAPTGHATLRFGPRLRLLANGRLEVRARCIIRGPGVTRCRQRLVLRVAHKVVARLPVDIGARGLYHRIIRLGRSASFHLVHRRPARVGLHTCAWSGLPCSNRGSVAVTRPLRRQNGSSAAISASARASRSRSDTSNSTSAGHAIPTS